MDIIVCVKRVPFTQEVDLEIGQDKKDIDRSPLVYALNDWDGYAIEEAVLIKEQFGGTITAITLGSEDDEEVLRRCLAVGTDKAMRIDPGSRELDGYGISRVLSEVIRGLSFDLILTGVQAEDDNQAMIGIMTAEQLGLAHAAVVTGIEVKDQSALIRCELEDGLEERSILSLPALLTIQSGINEPRYVSLMGIKKAAKKGIETVLLTDLNLTEEDLAPRTHIEEVYLPPDTEGADMIIGEPSRIAEEILRLLKEKGVRT
ncbi:MAG: electron transfer flavoprotein subunit beta/FixA family protein [Deltaproteobacteria bacterium]|nr:electron transfer flavoprotein subunit beta/FixA family protein [Deltaproteobacteria bacterium]